MALLRAQDKGLIESIERIKHWLVESNSGTVKNGFGRFHRSKKIVKTNLEPHEVNVTYLTFNQS